MQIMFINDDELAREGEQLIRREMKDSLDNILAHDVTRNMLEAGKEVDSMCMHILGDVEVLTFQVGNLYYMELYRGMACKPFAKAKFIA